MLALSATAMPGDSRGGPTRAHRVRSVMSIARERGRSAQTLVREAPVEFDLERQRLASHPGLEARDPGRVVERRALVVARPSFRSAQTQKVHQFESWRSAYESLLSRQARAAIGNDAGFPAP
jgi:hypothetical protein